MTELSITVDQRANATVVVARGKILYDTLQPLDTAFKYILASAVPQIVIDLHEVTLCDSSGLQLFLDTRQRAAAAGGWFRLCRPQSLVLRVLEITNLTSLLSIYKSVDAAVSVPDFPGSAPPSGDGPPGGRRNDDPPGGRRTDDG